MERQFGSRSFVLVLLTIGAIGASFGPWLKVATTDSVDYWSPPDTPILWVLILIPEFVGIVVALIGWRRRNDAAFRFVAVLSTLTFSAIAVGAIVLESFAALIPRDLVPATVRRGAFDLGTSYGLWTAVLSFAVSAVVASPLGKRIWERKERQRFSGTSLFLGFGILTVAVVLGVLRNQPWVTAAVAGRRTTLEGWELPWVGPLSLVIVWGALAALLLASMRRYISAGLVLALAGAVTSLTAIVVHETSEALGRARAVQLNIDDAHRYSADVTATGSVWVLYAVGVGMASLAAGLLWRGGTRRGAGGRA